MRVIEQNGKYFGETNVLGIGKTRPELRYGKVAKKLREDKDMTVEQLSKELSLKVKHIEEIEAQTKGMTEDVMQRYCDYFGVVKEDFFDLDLEKLICGDNGVVLKTYESSEECLKEFNLILEKFVNNELKDIIIDFREN